MQVAGLPLAAALRGGALRVRGAALGAEPAARARVQRVDLRDLGVGEQPRHAHDARRLRGRDRRGELPLALGVRAHLDVRRVLAQHVPAAEQQRAARAEAQAFRHWCQ